MAFITSYWEIKSKQDIRAEVINMIGQERERETLTPFVPKAGGFVRQTEHRLSRQWKEKRLTVAKYRTRVSTVNQLSSPPARGFVIVLMLLVFWLFFVFIIWKQKLLVDLFLLSTRYAVHNLSNFLREKTGWVTAVLDIDFYSWKIMFIGTEWKCWVRFLVLPCCWNYDVGTKIKVPWPYFQPRLLTNTISHSPSLTLHVTILYKPISSRSILSLLLNLFFLSGKYGPRKYFGHFSF